MVKLAAEVTDEVLGVVVADVLEDVGDGLDEVRCLMVAMIAPLNAHVGQ